MRVFKVTYSVQTKKDSCIFWTLDSIYSERFTCKTIKEAIEYGKGKAEKLGFHFEGVAEMKS